MAFLNEEDPAENVKKFPVLYDKSNGESHRKDIEKMHGQKLLSPLEWRMVGCLYNKAANCTCSRDISRTTAVSEIEFLILSFL